MNDNPILYDFYHPENIEKISRVLEIELQLTTAVIAGHQAHNADEFRFLRKEIEALRSQLVRITLP